MYVCIYICIYIFASPLGGNQAVRYRRLAFSLFPPPLFSLPRSLVCRPTPTPPYFRGREGFRSSSWRHVAPSDKNMWHTQHKVDLEATTPARHASEVHFVLRMPRILWAFLCTGGLPGAKNIVKYRSKSTSRPPRLHATRPRCTLYCVCHEFCGPF